MGTVTEINHPTYGLVGYLHEVEGSSTDSVLIFQLPRKTSMINEEYSRSAMNAVKKTLPEGKSALIIGCDVNVYDLAGPDAIILKLRGLI